MVLSIDSILPCCLLGIPSQFKTVEGSSFYNNKRWQSYTGKGPQTVCVRIVHDNAENDDNEEEEEEDDNVADDDVEDDEGEDDEV